MLTLPFERCLLDTPAYLAVQEALTETQGDLGDCGEKFEEAMARFCGAAHAVAFNSESSAFEGAFFAAEIGPFDRFVTSPNNEPYAVAAAMRFTSHIDLVDIDQNSGNLDTRLLLEAVASPLSRGTHVIMPVHYAGIPANVEKIAHILHNPNAWIIEDGGNAFGGSYLGKRERIGSCAWSDMTVISTRFPRPAMTGLGAMVFTNQEPLYRRLLLYRNGGRDLAADPKLVLEASPYCALSGFQAALGLAQVPALDLQAEKLRPLLLRYRERLADTPYLSMAPEGYDAYAHPQWFPVQIDFEGLQLTRQQVQKRMLRDGISTGEGHTPIYRHPFYSKRYGEKEELFPRMETFAHLVLALPLYPSMTVEEVDLVAEGLKRISDD
jgi:dTDP-4-amino-4,6-dideoxygalactose transaminase